MYSTPGFPRQSTNPRINEHVDRGGIITKIMNGLITCHNKMSSIKLALLPHARGYSQVMKVSREQANLIGQSDADARTQSSLQGHQRAAKGQTEEGRQEKASEGINKGCSHNKPLLRRHHSCPVCVQGDKSGCSLGVELKRKLCFSIRKCNHCFDVNKT